MSTLIACDLDQTLIYSPGALRLAVPDRDAPSLMSVEVIDGRPAAFMTTVAVNLLVELSRDHLFVPCTTRTVEQFQRVRLPLGVSIGPQYAVTSNGGTLLLDGEPDLTWHRRLADRIAATATPLAEVTAELKRRAHGDWVLKRRTADHLFVYLVVDLARVPVGFLDEWGSWLAERGWVQSVQGRKVYSTPVELRKSSAVEEVMSRTGAQRLIAAGDGWLDAEMLERADAGIRPSHGELAGLGWNRPNVAVTEATGIMAGQEILRWFAQQMVQPA